MLSKKPYSFIPWVAAIAFFLGLSVLSAAETLDFKLTTQIIRTETPHSDADGHATYFVVEKLTFENGELATIGDVAPEAYIGGSGLLAQTVSMTFKDKSTITIRRNGNLNLAADHVYSIGNWTSEILYGTGRFEGIKGNETTRAEFILGEQGEVVREGEGEGTMVYIVPEK